MWLESLEVDTEIGSRDAQKGGRGGGGEGRAARFHPNLMQSYPSTSVLSDSGLFTKTSP